MPIYSDIAMSSTSIYDGNELSFPTPCMDDGPIHGDDIRHMILDTPSNIGRPLVSPMGRGPKGDKGDKGDPGTTDYNDLENKPSIESVPLIGDSTFVQLGLQSLTNQEIETLLT